MKIMLLDQIAKVNYKYFFSLANALVAEGHSVVLSLDQKMETEGCECEKFHWFNTDEKKVSKIRKFINYISSYKKIYKELKKNKYDILHVQWMIFSPLDFYFLKKIKKNCKIKLVDTIHDILPFNQKFYDLKYHKKIYNLADKIIIQADNNIQRFDSLFPNLKSKVSLIPHGHFLDYAEYVDQKNARLTLDLPQEKMIFLFFGQIKKVKGLGVLLEAFAQYCNQFHDAILVIAGSVWKDDFSSYEKIIKDNNISDFIKQEIRYISDDELKYFFNASDCCVLPYLDVYQSGVIQLCYAYQKAVVATDLGAFREVVLDRETGFLCKVNDVTSLCNALIEARQQKDKLGEFGQKGYNYIKEKYSWKKIGSSISGIYKSLYE